MEPWPPIARWCILAVLVGVGLLGLSGMTGVGWVGEVGVVVMLVGGIAIPLGSAFWSRKSDG